MVQFIPRTAFVQAINTYLSAGLELQLASWQRASSPKTVYTYANETRSNHEFWTL